MSIIKRSKRDTPFVQIDKRGLHDPNLSWKAKGILAYILSLPDDWQLYVKELTKHAKDGKDSTARGMNELIDAGYIIREYSERQEGKFTGYDYTVYETPRTVAENPFPVKPFPENQQLLIIEDTNKDLKCVCTPENDKRPNTSLPFDLVTARYTLDALYDDWKKLATEVKEIKGFEVSEEIAKKCLHTFVSEGIARYYKTIRDITKLQSLLYEWVVSEIKYQRNQPEEVKEMPFDEYLANVVDEREIRELKHLKKLDKLLEARNKTDFQYQNIAKSYENNSITANLVFEVCHMKLGNVFTAQSAKRKLEQFQKWLKSLNDYEIKKGNIRELLKSKK